MPTSNTEEAEYYEDLQDLLERRAKNDDLFITGEWNARLGSRTWSKFGLGVQNKAGQG